MLSSLSSTVIMGDLREKREMWLWIHYYVSPFSCGLAALRSDIFSCSMGKTSTSSFGNHLDSERNQTNPPSSQLGSKLLCLPRDTNQKFSKSRVDQHRPFHDRWQDMKMKYFPSLCHFCHRFKGLLWGRPKNSRDLSAPRSSFCDRDFCWRGGKYVD